MNEILTEQTQIPGHRQDLVIPAAGAATYSPDRMLQIAVEQGADLDKLERLMALQEKWQKQQAKAAYDQAFAAFKGETIVIIKNQTVKDGPLKGKKFADLSAVVEAATPALSKHGLSSFWRLTKDEKDWIEVTCYLRHHAGHEESVSMGGPPDTGGAKNGIQARASSVTYLERYTFKQITGLSETEDDTDGNAPNAGVVSVWASLISRCDSIEDLNKLAEQMKSESTKADTTLTGKVSAELRSVFNAKRTELVKGKEAA